MITYSPTAKPIYIVQDLVTGEQHTTESLHAAHAFAIVIATHKAHPYSLSTYYPEMSTRVAGEVI